MSSCIKAWNAAWQVIIDVSDRLAYHHSTINLWNIGARASSTISIPGYSSGGTWFLFFRGSLNVKSAATCARMEIENNVIRVYDAAGTLRVKRGNLL